MSTIFDEAARIAKEAVPKVLCGAGGLSRLGQDIAGKVNPFYSGSLLEGYQNAVTGALQGFCPVPPVGPVPTPETPFEGGQCAATYRVLVDFIFYAANGSQEQKILNDQEIVGGPINEIKLDTPLAVPNQAGQTRYQKALLTTPTQTRTLFDFAASGNGITAFENVRITRLDGLPDDCGNPPPVFPPGTPNPNPPNPPPVSVEIDLPDVGPVVVAFTPVVGIVYVDANAEFNVPVTVNVDLGGLDISFDLDFDVNLSDPTKPPKPTPPDRPKNPDDRVDPQDCPPPSECINEPEEDEPAVDPPPVDPKEFRVVGAASLCLVDLSVATATEILQESGPNIWAPRLGYIRFQYLTNTGETVWGVDIAVKGTNFVTGAPDVGLRCVGAVLNTERGVSGELILLKKKVTAGCC